MFVAFDMVLSVVSCGVGEWLPPVIKFITWLVVWFCLDVEGW